MSGGTKAGLKRIASVLYTHRRSDLPDIFIHSTQRSGSTLLFDAISSQPGMKAVGEPLQERKHAVASTYIQTPRSRYFDLDSEVAVQLQSYLDALLSGRYVGGFERSYNIRNPRHHFFTQRNVVKILRTFACTHRIAEMYPRAKHIALTRHPIPTILSRVRNRWHAPIEEFLASPSLLQLLTEEQLALLRKLAASSQTDRHIAVWLVEHFGAERHLDELRQKEVPLIAFEHVVREPGAAAGWLSNTMTIPNAANIAHRLGLPSRSTRHSTAETTRALAEGRAVDTLSRWTGEVEDKTRETVSHGLSLFGIEFYEANSVEPKGRLTLPPWQTEIPG